MQTLVSGGDLFAGDFASSLLSRPDGTASRGDGSFVPSAPSGVSAGGFFHVECVDRDGVTRWVDDTHNVVVNGALDSILNVYLRAVAAITTWYLGLVDNAGFTAFAVGDTMASHAGWVESQDYTQATRNAWVPGASSGQTVTNGTTVDFSMNATKTIRGIFLNSANDKGGTTGTLFSTAAFSGGNQAVANGDTLKVTYTVSAASS